MLLRVHVKALSDSPQTIFLDLPPSTFYFVLFMLKTNRVLPLSLSTLFCSLGHYKYVRTCTTLNALHPAIAFCQVTKQTCLAVVHHLPLETSWLLFNQSLMKLSAHILSFSPLKFLLPHLSHGSCLNTSACLLHSTTLRCAALPTSLNKALILCTLSLRDHTSVLSIS